MDRDRVNFLFADVGETHTIAASVASARHPLPLPEGRYLVHVPIQSDAAALVWICFGARGATGALVATAAVGKQRVPLSRNTFTCFELNVLKGYNDEVAAITSAGTATVYISKVSRQ